MNSNICWLLVRLAILLGVLLVQSSEEATYQQFANRHIDSSSNTGSNLNAYCNQMMARRGMTRPRCKPTNTFMKANPSSVQNVCRGGGRHWRRNLYDSRSSFRMVVCRNTGSATQCRYRGRALTRRVRLACVNRLPVHFERVL